MGCVASVGAQNLRGGTVALQSLIMPDIELGNNPQGDALYAMELTLALERLNNEKLLALHKASKISASSEFVCILVCRRTFTFDSCARHPLES